jgi:hypothetical protein
MKNKKETYILYFRWLEHCSLEQQIGFDYLGLKLAGKKEKELALSALDGLSIVR